MAKKVISFVILFFLVSCADSLQRNKFIVAGTYLEVISPRPEAAAIVLAEFRRLDKIFNHYDPDSELSRLNRTFNKKVKVSTDLLDILKLSQQLYRLSDQAFDVSSGVLYDFWKELIKEGKTQIFPDSSKIKELKKTSGMDNIEINISESTVIIKKAGLKIDLDGVAKGYMVDKAIQRLKANGIESALINAGGDLYCLGKNKDKPWKAGIKDPESINGIVESQNLVDEAIATSGNYEQFFEFKGERYSHLVDPRSGYPVKNDILSVSVVSKNCLTADSLATAFFILGLDGVKDFIAKNPFTIKIFVVTLGEQGENLHIFQ